MKISFSEVSLTGTKTYTDKNGKRRRKQKKFMQTINPFNKNKHGEPKTRKEILEELKQEIKVWQEFDEVV